MKAEAAKTTGPEWPADKVERRRLDELKPYANNARIHSPAQIEQIAASIREFGFTIPLLLDEQGELIAGHGRAQAALSIGIETVPVMVARGWTDRQIKAYRIADNKLALNASWDEKLLAAELETLRDLSELVGFSELDLRKLGMSSKPGLTDPDAVPVVDEPITEAGDLWICGAHRLLCGDATNAADVARALGGVVPSLMVTDPPYGVEYDAEWRARAGVNKNRKKMGKVANDERVDWREAWALFPGLVAYVWHAGKHAAEVQQSLESCGFEIRSQIIWAKDRFALSRGHYHWQHEPCWYAVRANGSGSWTGDRSQSTLWEVNSRDDDGHGHSTQKPVELMLRSIRNNSNIGQAVYDPFAGTGTTMIAAEMETRSAISIDINPAYCDVAVKRWEEFTGQAATRESREDAGRERPIAL